MLTKNKNGISHDIYRKPTTTDTIIPTDSCHPLEQKMATIRYFADRINTYELSEDKKQTEIDTVKYMLRTNSYDVSLLDKMTKEQGMKKYIHQQSPEHPKPKWAKFTYVGNVTRTITKLFRHSQVKTAFTTKNNLIKILRNNSTEEDNKYARSGIYQLKCSTCGKIYVGQSGRPSQYDFGNTNIISST